ncbi:MAG: Sugar transporter [Hyphomicrobiales bacterium]|nr:Sugar transporter [Hyphomicrobiales bacterium]
MLRITGVLALTTILSGCSTLPATGPSASDLAEQSVSGETQNYEIIDVTPSVIDTLAARWADNLLATFGDYRPSIDTRIGVGDTISVTIWEAAAGGLFSAPLLTDRFSTGSKSATIPEQVVGRDGAISVPYAGRIKVAGQTVAQVQTTVERALDGKAIQPQVLINVIRPISNSVTVTGEVANGARIPLSVAGDRLLEVIATAGGIRAPVNETFIQLSRGQKTVRVAMSRVVRDPSQNIYLRPNDVVTLVREPQNFVAFGATGANAVVPFDADGISLSEAIAKAGGLIDSRADPSGVFVLRYEPEATARRLVPGSPLIQPGRSIPIVYRLNLRDSRNLFLAQKFRIFAKDTLYVTNAPFTEAQKGLQIFYMMTAPVGTGAALYKLAR